MIFFIHVLVAVAAHEYEKVTQSVWLCGDDVHRLHFLHYNCLFFSASSTNALSQSTKRINVYNLHIRRIKLELK